MTSFDPNAALSGAGSVETVDNEGPKSSPQSSGCAVAGQDSDFKYISFAFRRAALKRRQSNP